VKFVSFVFCILILFPSLLRAQGDWADSFQRGMQMGMQQRQMEMEERRLQMEEQLTRQRMELMKQEAQTARQQRQRESDNLYETAFKDGYTKGIDDTIADLKKREPATRLETIDKFGDTIFKETSIENLLVLKKKVNEVREQNPTLSLFRVYNVLISDRLKELQPLPEPQKNEDINQNKKSKTQRRK
jgi:Sec-independent protein translocase protein TatA